MLTHSLLNHLSEAILGYQKDLPILVGIDGVDASGKTTLADKLADRLEASNRRIIRASIDGFHNPRAIRWYTTLSPVDLACTEVARP